MNDLYNERLDAMKARESWHGIGNPNARRVIEKAHNVIRLAAYKRKRAAYDRREFISMEYGYD